MFDASKMSTIHLGTLLYFLKFFFLFFQFPVYLKRCLILVLVLKVVTTRQHCVGREGEFPRNLPDMNYETSIYHVE